MGLSTPLLQYSSIPLLNKIFVSHHLFQPYPWQLCIRVVKIPAKVFHSVSEIKQERLTRVHSGLVTNWFHAVSGSSDLSWGSALEVSSWPIASLFSLLTTFNLVFRMWANVLGQLLMSFHCSMFITLCIKDLEIRMEVLKIGHCCVQILRVLCSFSPAWGKQIHLSVKLYKYGQNGRKEN